MGMGIFKPLIILFFLVFSLQANASLYLFGGGTKPKNALSQFIQEANARAKIEDGPKQIALIVMVPWATEQPKETCDQFKKDLGEAVSYQVFNFVCAPTKEQVPSHRAQVIELLQAAHGLFFSGGDQNKIMDVLDRDPSLLRLIQQRFKSGLPVGGTSAGTAIQSELMISAERVLGGIDPKNVELRPGLGLIKDVIVDQHFIVRNRENRLKSALIKSQFTVGIGVDEGAVALVSSNKKVIPLFGKTVILTRSGDDFAKIILTPKRNLSHRP